MDSFLHSHQYALDRQVHDAEIEWLFGKEPTETDDNDLSPEDYEILQD